ncbi:MAG: glycosyltransferase, partial [Candidatus Nanoarchaeia archaeon]|nr:glycosyltransferase [Candidatus Nanoarchaeia archaeon]
VRILQTPDALTDDIDMYEWEKKMCVIPPGVDVKMFHPMTEEESTSKLLKDILQHAKSHSQMGPQLITEEHYWETDILELFRLSTADTNLHPFVLYYGRYLWTKGIQMIAITIPLIMQRFPNARFIFTGFGPSQTYVETLITYLHHGREELFLESIQHPDLWDAQISSTSVLYIQSFLDWMQDPKCREKYFYAARNEIQKSVYFTGYLDQPILSKLVRSVDLTVFPFIVPESFGQVVIESLSSGVLPIMTTYTALSEVYAIYQDSLQSFFPNMPFKPISLDEDLIFSMKRCIVDVLETLEKMTDLERKELRSILYSVTSSVFSWESMIQKYLHFT